MSLTEHSYALKVEWTGNLGTGTSGYRDYSRDHIVRTDGAPDLAGSADPTFRGSVGRWNPEQLLLAALSQCHMLSYLHTAVEHQVTVTAYRDQATGIMDTNPDGSGQFREATLHPLVVLADPSQTELAQQLHKLAAEKCFIARSVNFPVNHVIR